MRYIDFIAFTAREHPDREFAADAERSVTYGQAMEIAARVANAQRDLGLGVGDRVAVLGENSIEYVLFYLGCALSGCVPTPLNYRLVQREWSYLLKDSRAKMILADESFIDDVDQMALDLPDLTGFVCTTKQDRTPWVSFEDWIGATSPHRGRDVLPAGAAMYQIYTSGTTGLPKGVVVSHEVMAIHQAQQHASLGPTGALEGRLLAVAPMFHSGITGLWMAGTTRGGSVFVQRRFNAADVLHAFREERISWALLVPAMIRACLKEMRRDGLGAPEALRMILYGGSPVSESLLRDAMDTFGCDFMQTYGLSECNTAVALLPSDHRRALAGRPEILKAAGRALPGVELRIVDADRNDLPPRQLGEIAIAGPMLMSGYWQDPEKTAEVLSDGWIYSGDAGYLDEDGYLYISDRVKDMIVSGGENIYPREIEGVILEHPAVADVAVIGVPSEQWGEAVAALIVLEDGAALTETELIAHCRLSLAGYKCPKQVGFVSELPRNPSGKILKRQLRERYWKGHERRV